MCGRDCGRGHQRTAALLRDADYQEETVESCSNAPCNKGRQGTSKTDKYVSFRYAMQEALEKHRQHVVGRNDRQSYANDLERERLARQDDRQRRYYLVRAHVTVHAVGQTAPPCALAPPLHD